MAKERIFVHIPKTGGTTLDCAIKGKQWTKNVHDIYYRHIHNQTKLSNAGDLLEESNFPKYKKYDIYTMLRHPVDRLVSEYFFVRDRKEFFSLIKKRPRNLKEFAANVQTRNYMVNFLNGGRIYPTETVTRRHLDKAIRAIDELPIHVGIFEEYDKSLKFFSNKMGVKWPKKIEVKRITLNRPKLAEVSQEVKDLIVEKNQLDLELYNYCKQKFDEQNIKSAAVTIEKDRYSYVMKYTERFALFELFMREKSFISNNQEFFRHLSVYLHQHIDFTEGRRYVLSWNKNVLNALKAASPDFPIQQFESSIEDEDPLLKTEALSKFLLKKMKTDRAFSRTKLKFEYDKMELFDPIVKKKGSFFSRLFSRK